MPSILDLAYEAPSDQIAEAANLPIRARIQALSQSSQIAKAMTPTSNQLSRMAEAVDPPISQRIRVMTQSTQMAAVLALPPSPLIKAVATSKVLSSAFTNYPRDPHEPQQTLI